MNTAVSLGGLDYGIIALYFIVTLGIGFWVARQTKTGEDLFLAGRSLDWKPIGFSLFASNISSTTLIGLAGAAYLSGIAVSAYEWMAALIVVFMAIVVIPLYLKAGITTIPEFLEVRFNRKCRLYFSAITIVLSIIVDTAGGLYGGAVVLKTFFPDLVLWHVTFTLCLITGLYTAAGGLKAVVYTDTIQAIVLIAGSAILTWMVFGHYDYSWANARDALPDGHLSLVRPLDDDTLPWLGLFFGVPILGFWYWATNQYITQRVLGAKDLSHARKGSLLCGVLKLLPLFIMVLPGAMAIALYPDLPTADAIFPTLVANELPVGLTGLVLAGLVAAIMSSVSSTLNSASTLVTCDFIQKPGRELDPKKVAFIGRTVTIILMLIAAAWAPMIAKLGGLFDYLQQAFSILVPPVAAVFLMGYFGTKLTGYAAIRTLVIGHLAGIVLFVLGQEKLCAALFGTEGAIWPLHFTINVIIMTLLSALLFVLLSRKTSAETMATNSKLVWTREMALPEHTTPFYRNYLWQSGAVLLLTALMAVAFW